MARSNVCGRGLACFAVNISFGSRGMDYIGMRYGGACEVSCVTINRKSSSCYSLHFCRGQEWPKSLHFSHLGGFHSYSAFVVLGSEDRGLSISKLCTKRSATSISTQTRAYSNLVLLKVCSSQD